jgi:small-conductance mechanosensitive channel
MPIPRLYSDPVFNNVVLTAAATVGLLLVTWLVKQVLTWTVRRMALAVRSESVISAGERVQKSLRGAATVVSLVIILSACATLAFAIFREIDLHPWVNSLAGYSNIHNGRSLVVALLIVAAFLIGLLLLRSILRALLRRLEGNLKAFEPLATQSEAITLFMERTANLGNIVAFYLIYKLSAPWLPLPPVLHGVLAATLYVILVLCAALSAALLAVLLIDALDRVGAARFEPTRFSAYYASIRGLWQLAKRILEAIIYLAAATLIVRQFEVLESFAPYGPRIIRMLATFFAARVAVEMTRVLLIETFVGNTKPDDELSKRRVTLVYLIQSVIKYVIYFGSILIMMKQLGIDTTPFLAGAGIVGLAGGLGAQKLVNDMVSGFFILFEGHLLKGDWVQIDGKSGEVDSIQLRVTTLRDAEGRLITLRNGEIGTIVNYSREFVYAVVDVTVAAENNLGKVLEALNEAGSRLQASRSDRNPEQLFIKGLDRFDGKSMTIRVSSKISPGKTGNVTRMLRMLIKETFDERGIKQAEVNSLAVAITEGRVGQAD